MKGLPSKTCEPSQSIIVSSFGCFNVTVQDSVGFCLGTSEVPLGGVVMKIDCHFMHLE